MCDHDKVHVFIEYVHVKAPIWSGILENSNVHTKHLTLQLTLQVNLNRQFTLRDMKSIWSEYFITKQYPENLWDYFISSLCNGMVGRLDAQ